MQFWTFAENWKTFEAPGPLSPRIKEAYKRYLFPFKDIVNVLFPPQYALKDFDLYQNFTAKIFLNFFIKKKFKTLFPGNPFDKNYLFPIFEKDKLNVSDKKIFHKVIKKIEESLEHYYQDFPDTWILDPDLLGKVYNEILYNFKKIQKNKGQFFTSPAIVKSMIKEGMEFFQEKNKLPERILDPAGGAGVFLNQIFLSLKKELKKSGYSLEESIKHLFDNVIWGFDLDPIAVFLMKINLSFLSGIPSLFPKNIFIGDFFLKGKNPENILNKSQRKGVKFDWIIGNPPWGSRLSDIHIEEIRSNYKIGKGEINSFTAFLEHSLELIGEGGLLSQLLPESLLNIRAHKIIRKEILDSTRIISIHVLGDIFRKVFAPAIYFHSEKQFMSTGNFVCMKDHRSIGTKNKGTGIITREVSQEKFRKNPHYIFSVYSNKTSENLNNLIEKGSDRLSNHGKYYMGIVTGNNAKHIHPHKYHQKAERVITGKDIIPYYIRPSGNWIYFRSNVFQQVCDESFFTKKNKLIYKFISSKLKFAIDREKRYHINSVNGFYLFEKSYSPEYLMTLLNSQLLNHYFTQKFFTRRVLRGDLEMVPIMAPGEGFEKKLTSLATSYENFLEENYDLFYPRMVRPLNNKENGRRESKYSREELENINRKYLKDIEESVLDLYKIPSYLRKDLLEKIS